MERENDWSNKVRLRFSFLFIRFFREWSFQSKKLCVGEIINLTQWYGKAEKRGEEKRRVYLLGEKVK